MISFLFLGCSATEIQAPTTRVDTYIHMVQEAPILHIDILKKSLDNPSSTTNFENLYNLYFLNKWISYHVK